MGSLSPLGPVFHAGTLAGNPIATAAGLAALDLLDDGVYELLEARVERLSARLSEVCRAAGLAVSFPTVGTLMGMYLGDGPTPIDFAAAKTTDEAAYARFFHAMLSEGVALAPGAYEAIFVGLAHDDAVIDRVIDAASRAARVAADG